MPVYALTRPDGTTVDIEGPKDASLDYADTAGYCSASRTS
jgi:hypothetical protein